MDPLAHCILLPILSKYNLTGFFLFFFYHIWLCFLWVSLNETRRNSVSFSNVSSLWLPPPPNKKPSHFSAIDMVSRHLFVHLPKLFTLFFRKKVFFSFLSLIQMNASCFVFSIWFLSRQDNSTMTSKEKKQKKTIHLSQQKWIVFWWHTTLGSCLHYSLSSISPEPFQEFPVIPPHHHNQMFFSSLIIHFGIESLGKRLI